MKFFTHTLQFLVGFFATVSIGLFNDTGSVEVVEVPTKNPVAARARLIDPVETVSDRNIRVEANFPELRDALEQPSSLLNLEMISQLDNYENQILPYLKEVSLKMLMDKFTIRDWREWPRTALMPLESSSAARNYIREIGKHNRPLASFLELSSLFIHRAANSIDEGKSYNIEDDSISIEDYKALLEYADSKDVLRRMSLDPVFMSAFRKFECAFASTYISTATNLNSLNYSILDQTVPYLCSEGAVLQLEQFVTGIIQSGDKDSAYMLLANPDFERAIKKFADSHKNLRTRVSLLYTFAASAALNDGDPETADYLYRNALKIDPTSRGHLSFANIFSKIKVPEPVIEQEELVTEVEPIQVEESSSYGWLLVAAVLVAFSGIVFTIRKI